MTWDYRKFLGNKLLQKCLKVEESILFLRVIITELIQNLVEAFVQFSGFHVNVQPVSINLIKIGYQLFLHNLNHGMPVLKIVTITKYLNIKMIGPSWNYKTTQHPKLSLTNFTH